MRHPLRWRPLAGVLLCAGLLMPVASAQVKKDQQPNLLLEEATKKELVDGDLTGAIETYRRILKLDGVPRAVAAKTLLRLGQCYEKLGTNEARGAYERIVREFADQAEEAGLARERLTRLGQPAGAARPVEMTMRRVWDGPDVDSSGAPSRDGAYLTFKEWPSEDLAIRDLATGESRALTRHRGDLEFVYSSVPSPDGKQVAYSWYNADGFCDLRVVGLGGSDPRILYRNAEVKWLSPTDWSPDGKTILAVLPRREGDQIALVAVADGSVRVLKTLAPGTARRPRFSTDGRWVAFDLAAQPGAEQHDVFLLALDSGRELPLVQHAADDSVLDWTPDGRGLLFRSDRTGAPGAWMITVADGIPAGDPVLVKPGLAQGFTPLGFTRQGSYYFGAHTPTSEVYVAEIDASTGRVTEPALAATSRFAGSNNKPDWSPDGRHLIFLSHVGSVSGWDIRAICMRPTQGGEVQDVVPKLNRINWLRWFPDGQSLLAGGNPGPNRAGIYRIDVRTGDYTRLSDMSLGWPSVPSRNGKAVFRLRWHQDVKRTAIVELDLETGKERDLHGIDAPSLLQSSLALSPDGQHLAFVLAEGEGRTKVVQALPTKGGAVRDVLRGIDVPFPASVAWMPDDRSLLVVRQPDPRSPKTELWLVPVQGGEPRKLDLAAPNMRELAVHPDGRHIAFTSGGDRSEVWVMENFLRPAK